MTNLKSFEKFKFDLPKNYSPFDANVGLCWFLLPIPVLGLIPIYYFIKDNYNFLKTHTTTVIKDDSLIEVNYTPKFGEIINFWGPRFAVSYEYEELSIQDAQEMHSHHDAIVGMKFIEA